MKKWFFIAAAALLAVSCNLDNHFTQTNATEFLNIRNGSILNDNLVTYTVVSDETDQGWKNCTRIYALFDITGDNSTGTGYNIDLKNYAPAAIIQAAERAEDDVLGDPLYVGDYSISGGYLNLILQWYTPYKSTVEHLLKVTYEDNATANTLNLTIIHDAAGESEDIISKDGNENNSVHSEYISVPIYNLFPSGEIRSITLSFAHYDSSDEEEPVKQQAITLYSSVRF